MTTSPETTARLLVTCPDRPGIVAAATTFLYHHGANITELDQYSSDAFGGRFFLRLEFQTPSLDVTRDEVIELAALRVGSSSERGALDMLLRTGLPLTESSRVHGITPEMLAQMMATQGRPPVPAG